jgi:2-amino-4-hydroxy-6-hydroxymethyldihydropteridine diphosphokinase
LGSNHDQQQNLHQARQRLAQVLVSHGYTDAIWTEPLGQSHHGPYLNQLACGKTGLTLSELETALKAIEHDMGRTDEDRRQGIVRIDLDLLLFDQEHRHLPDWNRPYVTQLLCAPVRDYSSINLR